MKFISATLLFSAIALVNYAQAAQPKSYEMIRLIESKEIEKLFAYFDTLQFSSAAEAKKYLEEILYFVEHKYEKKENPLNEAKNIALRFTEKEIKDPIILSQANKIISLLTSNLLSHEELSLFKALAPTNFSPYLILRSKSKTENEKEEGLSIPGGVIVGGLETLCGALLWITPFRTVGSGMIVDGIRRMLNATEEKDNENKEKNLLKPSKEFQEFL